MLSNKKLKFSHSFRNFVAQILTGSLARNVSISSARHISAEKNIWDFVLSFGYVKHISSPKWLINSCFTLRLLIAYPSNFEFKMSRQEDIAYPFVSRYSSLIIVLKASFRSMSDSSSSSSSFIISSAYCKVYLFMQFLWLKISAANICCIVLYVEHLV